MFTNLQKDRRGLSRIWFATGYSLKGLRAGWHEPAFRFEAIAAIVMLPASFWLGRHWLEVAALAGSVLLVMIVELLNTAIEKLADRVTLEHDPIIGRVKDMGSAAVGLTLLLAGAVWLVAIGERLVTLLR